MAPMKTTSRAAVVAALVAVQIFFGFHYVAAKYIMTAIPPLPWATMRAVSAAVLILGCVLLSGHRFRWSLGDVAKIALCSVFGVVINQICFVEGLQRTDTSHSSIINSTIPVATLWIAILARRERVTSRKMAGIGLSLAGVVYLIAHSGTVLPRRFVEGDVLTVINALSYSIFLVISKPVLARHGSLSNTALLLMSGAVGIALIGGPQLARIDVTAVPVGIWGAAVLVVVFPTVGAYLLSFWALKRVESSTVALFIYMQPIIASLLALVLLGEPVGPEILLSGALIFAGLAVALRPR